MSRSLPTSLKAPGTRPAETTGPRLGVRVGVRAGVRVGVKAGAKVGARVAGTGLGNDTFEAAVAARLFRTTFSSWKMRKFDYRII